MTMSTIDLIEAEIPRLRRYARFLVGEADQADDLVQDCLTRAISKIDSWTPGTNIRAWLFVILRNSYYNDLRRQKRSPILHDVEPPLGSSPSNQESHMALVEVRKAFAKLSPEHRDVLALVAIEGVPYDEAASILSVPIGTVRSRASRARQILRDAVDKENRHAGQEPASMAIDGLVEG